MAQPHQPLLSGILDTPIYNTIYEMTQNDKRCIVNAFAQLKEGEVIELAGSGKTFTKWGVEFAFVAIACIYGTNTVTLRNIDFNNII